MAYRYYIGYIPKNKLEEVMKEVNRLESLIGTTDEEGNTICAHTIDSYLWNQATQIYCFGNLCSLDERVIHKIIYKNRLDNSLDSPASKRLFFFVNNKNFLYKLSRGYQSIWCDYLKTLSTALNKKKNERTANEVSALNKFKNVICNEITEYEISTSLGGKPYNENQFNYESVELYQMHTTFNYEDNALCVWTC